MSDPTILEMLRGVEFFHDISDEHLERLAEIARPVEFQAETEIFRENDKAEDLYVVISGQVSLIICEPKVGCRQLMQVGDGDLIGWSPLVARRIMSDTARTVTPTKALAINGKQALTLCGEDPQFGFEFMHRAAKTLAQRLNATRLKLLEMSGLQLPTVQIESD